MSRAVASFGLTLAVLVGACGKEPDAEPPSNIIELTMDADGAERGMGATSADGVVQFYSPHHEALFAIDLGDSSEAAVAGVEVHVEATETGVAYYASDPMGRYMPLVFHSQIPTSLDEELVVSGADSLLAGEPAQGPASFVAARPPTRPLIVGLVVSLNVRGILLGIGEAAALMVLGKIVSETCQFFAPLHEDTCGTVAKVVELAGAVGVGGLKLVLSKGYSWAAGLASAAWDTTWSELRGKACEAGGKLLVSWLVPPPDQEKTVQRRYREVAYAYRLLLDKLDTQPPADPTARAALKADLVAAGKALALVGPKVRDHYYELYNADAPDTFLTEASFAATAAAVKNLVEVRPLVFESLTLAYGYHELLVATSTSISYQRYEFLFGQLELSEGEPLETPWQLEWGVDCLMAAAKDASITWMENGAAQEAEVEIEQALGHMVDMIDMFLEAVHEEHFGGGIPDPDCLPDIWEPNDTWQSALAAPFAGTLGSGVVTLANNNLCNGMTAADTDWFTFDAAPINFGVEARIRAPMNGAGANERVCLELYWYSQINELAMAPPTALPGGACGTVASEFSTSMINVAQSTGEAYRYVMVRVVPDPGSPTPSVGIDYTLTFTH